MHIYCVLYTVHMSVGWMADLGVVRVDTCVYVVC